MTNPLEQIRELAEKWQNPKGNSDIHLAGIICGNEILKILDASHGYVCVPVEPTEAMIKAGGIAASEGGFETDIYDAMLAASKETNRE